MADAEEAAGTSGSEARVAFDLLSKIAWKERNSATQDRAYFLDLYTECRSVVVNGFRKEERSF